MGIHIEGWEQAYQTMLKDLRNRTPYSLSRWGDGEWIVALRLEAKWREALAGVRTVSGVWHNARFDDLTHALKNLILSRPAYYLGMQPLTLDPNSYYRGKGKTFERDPVGQFLAEHKLEGLRWVDANFLNYASRDGMLRPFIEICRKRGVVLVGPEHLSSIASSIGAIEHVVIPSLNCWMTYPDVLASSRAAVVKAPVNAITCISAGPPAKLLVDDLNKEFGARRTFIDTGSMWDVFAGVNSRSYQTRVDRAQLDPNITGRPTMMRSSTSGWYFTQLDKRGFKIRGAIHVGAHCAQELPFYEERGVKHQVWVEPQPGIYEKMLTVLPKRPEVRSFNVACGDEKGNVTFHCMSGFSGEASSVMPLKRHIEIHPQCRETHQIEVPVVSLDELLEEAKVDVANFNLLVNDTQGYELKVLKGAVKTLKQMEFAVVEVGKIELYEGAPLVQEVDDWMAGQGFKRQDSGWRGAKGVYGDVIYGR